MPLSKELQTYIGTHGLWTPGDHSERIRFLALAFAGEAGEMTGPVKKNWRGDKKATHEWMVAEVRKEIADCGNYLYMLCRELGLDLEEEMLSKFKEVELRSEYLQAHGLMCTCGHGMHLHDGPHKACGAHIVEACECMYFERQVV